MVGCTKSPGHTEVVGHMEAVIEWKAESRKCYVLGLEEHRM